MTDLASNDGFTEKGLVGKFSEGSTIFQVEKNVASILIAPSLPLPPQEKLNDFAKIPHMKEKHDSDWSLLNVSGSNGPK